MKNAYRKGATNFRFKEYHNIEKTFHKVWILLQILHFLSNALLSTNTTIDLEGGKRLALALSGLALAAIRNKM